MHELDRVDDDELVNRCRSGDNMAFNELIERYKKMGFSLAYNMTGAVEDAEDISQEAFVAVYANISKFRGGSSFKTWFYKIVLNLCRRNHRRKQVASFLPFTFFNKEGEEQTIEVKADSNPEKELSNTQSGKVIREAIRELPIRQKEIFIMKHIKGMKIIEISEVLQCAEGTVKSHLFRAVKKLQDSLGSLYNEV